MSHIGLTDFKFNVKPLYDSLQLHPEVWNTFPYRTTGIGSPHREVDDVWVRYNPMENFTGDWGMFNSAHRAVWYPVIQKIPEAYELSFELFKLLDAKQLGGVLLTRIPAGKQVYPHIDQGWHARYYEKYVIQVKGNKDQKFCFEGEELSPVTGECYWFDNAFSHWVTNHSDEERISLIVCVRRDLCLGA